MLQWKKSPKYVLVVVTLLAGGLGAVEIGGISSPVRATSSPTVSDFGVIVNDASFNLNRAPGVAINDSGNGMLLWTNNSAGSAAAGLKVATFSDSTSTWSATSSISTSASCTYPTAAISPTGDLLAACYKSGSPSQVLLFPKTSTINWTETTRAATFGGHIRTAWRNSNVPLVMYTGYSAAYKTYSTRLNPSDGSWTTAEQISFCAYSDYSSLAMANDGTSIVSMSGPTSDCNSGVSPLRGHFRSYDPGAGPTSGVYATGVLDSRSSAVTGITYTSSAINDASTKKGVVAYITGSDKSVHIQFWTAAAGFGAVTSLDNTTAAAAPVPGNTSRVNINAGIDNNGNVIVAWVQNDGTNVRVRWARYNGSTWTTPAWLSPSGADASSLTMQMAKSAGSAVLAYQMSDGSNSRIYLHEFSSSTLAWNSGTAVSTAGVDASFPALAVNSSGKYLLAWPEKSVTNWVAKAFGATVSNDTQAPTAPGSPQLATASDSGSSSSDRKTKVTLPTLTVVATENGGTVQVTATKGASTSICSMTGSTAGGSCVLGTALTDGEWTVTAVHTDADGNASAVSSGTTITVDTSTSTPTGLALTVASDTGSSSSDRITYDTTPTVSGTAEPGATVQLLVNSSPSGSTCTADATTGVFECTSMPVGEGTKVIAAEARDAAGNTSSTSATISIEIDATAPTMIPSLSGTLTCRPTWCDSDFISSTATPSFTGSAPNDTRVQLYIGGAATGAPCATVNGSTSGTFTCTTASLADGTYSVTATLLDVAGNESTTSYVLRSFQVVAGYVPTTTTSSTSTTSTTVVPSTSSSSSTSSSTTVVPSTSSSSSTSSSTTVVPSTSSSSSTSSSTTVVTTTTATTAPAAATTTVAPQSGTGRLVWYADSESGSDTTGNGSAAAPFASFHRAYTAARTGDIIDLTGTFTWTDAREAGDVAGAGYRLSKNLTIRGQGADRTVIESANRENVADRAVFSNSATVTLSGVTIRHGRVQGGNMAGGLINRGRLVLESVTVRDNRSVTASQYSFYTAGGIFTDTNSSISLDKVTVKDNVCDCVLYAAGGLYALQSANKTINNSTFVGNRASASRIGPFVYSYAAAAGAFNTFRFGFTAISNSTFFGNYSADYAGAMSIYYQDYANLTNLTIVGNEAALGTGGILYRSEWDGFNLNLKNVLLANNRGSGGANDFHAANTASAARMTSSYNIVEASNNKSFSGLGELSGQQASLDLADVLAPNSGRNGVDTLLIGTESIAKDTGDAAPHGGRTKASPPSADQRGFSRVGPVDIGAFENQSETNEVLQVTTTTSSSSTTLLPVTTVPTSTTIRQSSSTTAPKPTTTSQSRTTTSISSTVGAFEATINRNLVATTAPSVSTLPEDDAEDLTVEPNTDTEVKASNDSVEVVLSIVDKSFAEVLQGRTGRLVAKQGLYAKVRGKGFLPGSLAEVWVYSTPRLLAHLQVSSKGDASGFVLIPDDLEVGDHRVELRGSSERRRVVKATIPLTVLDDGVAATTIPADPNEIQTNLTLPTEIPAVVLPAPVDGQVSISEDVIKSVLAEVFGSDVDLSKVNLRIRINKGEWRLIDTSTGRLVAIVLPSMTGENKIEFEVTDENGETIVVERKVLVEGSPEATAYEADMSASDDGTSIWFWLLVALAVMVGIYLIGTLVRRRSPAEAHS